ncbi:unnamed protein product [Closterium sp. NIES-64]|nr:unnamed protein product [Closterium sp. NIES-64]
MSQVISQLIVQGETVPASIDWSPFAYNTLLIPTDAALIASGLLVQPTTPEEALSLFKSVSYNIIKGMKPFSQLKALAVGKTLHCTCDKREGVGMAQRWKGLELGEPSPRPLSCLPCPDIPIPPDRSPIPTPPHPCLLRPAVPSPNSSCSRPQPNPWFSKTRTKPTRQQDLSPTARVALRAMRVVCNCAVL